MADDFIHYNTYTDSALSVETGLYPGDRGPDESAVRIRDASTGDLIVEVYGANLTEPPHFDTPGMVRLTFTRDGTMRVPVRINSRTKTCAFPPLHEEPLENLNRRLSSFWKTSTPAPSVAPPRTDNRRDKYIAMLSLIGFGLVALYAVGGWWTGNGARILYVLAFPGMIATLALYLIRTLPRR